MCCIFTCCGWMVDLIQRVWTFSMSCIIMSAVMGVLTTASMSGIALGYNYSLAEYIDLKETNVSVYLKRGVFDDEIADDMEWRRAGHLPVAGHLNEDNLMTGASDESTTLRSGRRLDDSVFEADDQHKYEGSLMKLTARPLHEDPSTDVTDDTEMADSLSKYPMGSLDQMKAIQSLIDSRRAMGTGTTLSPLATYAAGQAHLPYLPGENNPNVLLHPEIQHRRTMYQQAPGYNPAREAVPSVDVIGNKMNWLGPKFPEAFDRTDHYYFRTSPTYPTAVTVRSLLIRPTTTPGDDYFKRVPPESVSFPYQSESKKPAATQPHPMGPSGREQGDQKPDFYNEKVLMEGEELSKSDNMKMPKAGWKSPEEEYEDEIKGLPVRKRRSIILSALVGEGRNPTEMNNKDKINNDNLSSVKNIFTSQTTINELDVNYDNTFTIDKNRSVAEAINDSNTDINEKHKLNLENKVESIPEHDRNENQNGGQSLLKHLVASIKTKEASLTLDTAPNEGFGKSSVKDTVTTISSSFESKIVHTKYVSNNLATRLEKKKPSINKGILNSFSRDLYEGLVRNPASSTLVKVLQSVLTT